MGFTVVGPGPLPRFRPSRGRGREEKLPPFLGLIESRDAGRTWRAVSLQGEADFHVLRSQRPARVRIRRDERTGYLQATTEGQRGDSAQSPVRSSTWPPIRRGRRTSLL